MEPDSEYSIIFVLSKFEIFDSKFRVRKIFVIIEIVIYCLGRQAPVAQWIARWTSNPKVVGSSPTWGKTFSHYSLRYSYKQYEPLLKSRPIALQSVSNYFLSFARL